MRNPSRFAAALGLLSATAVLGQGIVTAGLGFPYKSAVTSWGNILVAESNSGHNDGELTLVAAWGGQFRLLSGLPSGVAPEGSPLGPTAVGYAVSTVYITIGEGDSKGPAASPAQACNPQGLTSPIWSSLVAATFTPPPDAIREGFELSAANIQTLADGHTVELANDAGEEVSLRLVADFNNFIPDPVLVVRQANTYALAVDGHLTEADLAEFGYAGANPEDVEFLAQNEPNSALGQRLIERTTIYVVDAGMNTVTAVSAASGRAAVLARFAKIPNPLFPSLGGPVMDPVPTSVRVDGDSLLVTLLAGFPFPPGESRVMRVDKATGAVSEVVSGLSMSTDVVEAEGALYVLNLSTDFLAGAPGRIVRYDLATGESTTFAAPVIGATGISLRAEERELIVTEAFTGLMKRFPLP